MLFNSYTFVLAFLPAFCLLYFAARKASYDNPGMRGVCKWIIVAGSLLFYAPFGLKNLAVLAVSICFNYFAVRALEGEKKTGAGQRSLLALTLSVNVAGLLFFKFSGLFFPVAISFYTFNQISLLVDVYRKDVKKVSLPDYLAYILFFPKLLQGPLMRYGEFEEKLKASLDGAGAAGMRQTQAKDFYEELLRGLFLFSMGLFKKVILADTFGKAVDYGFENIMSLGSLEAALVAVFYSLQLYFDFSGYCDMAMAVSKVMGFELPLNFNSPYKAVNIVDFWKRWHITLTGFFTGYLYIPLGGNRRGQARMYLNFMIVFLVSGLWHGNGWNFILWGAMHGVLFVITRAWLKGTKDKTGSATGEKGAGPRIVGAFKVILTFIYVTLAWVFFRAASISEGAALITRIFTGGRKALATQLTACFQLDELWYVIKVTPLMRLSFVWDICLWIFVAVSVIMIFFSPNAYRRVKTCRIGVMSTLLTAALLIWSIISFGGVSTFLYMNF